MTQLWSLPSFITHASTAAFRAQQFDNQEKGHIQPSSCYAHSDTWNYKNNAHKKRIEKTKMDGDGENKTWCPVFGLYCARFHPKKT